jgi:anti-anti-sigma factor
MTPARSVPDEPRYRIEIVPAPDWTVIAVAGEMDLAVADEFAATVRGQLATHPVRLDLHELSFVDSSGVRVLDALLRDVQREGWTLAIDATLQEGVRQVLAMTGLLAHLPMREVDGS